MTAICHVERVIALGAVYLLLPYRWAVVVIPEKTDRVAPSYAIAFESNTEMFQFRRPGFEVGDDGSPHRFIKIK